MFHEFIPVIFYGQFSILNTFLKTKWKNNLFCKSECSNLVFTFYLAFFKPKIFAKFDQEPDTALVSLNFICQ